MKDEGVEERRSDVLLTFYPESLIPHLSRDSQAIDSLI